MRKIGCLVVACLFLAACAGQGGSVVTTGGLEFLRQYPNRTGSEQVDFYWKCDAAQAGQVRVEGAVHTLRTGQVKFVEVELIAADAQGKPLGSAKSTTKDLIIGLNQTSTFAVALTAPAGMARVDLYYRYNVDQVSGADPWPHFFMRDACSPTAHLRKG
jgi:hypothetical protein